MGKFSRLGNDLYTGKRSFNFVGGRKKWYAVVAVLLILSVLVPVLRGFNFGIEFRGGSQFQIAGVADATSQPAIDAVASVAPDAVAKVTIVGNQGVRVQTDQLEKAESEQVSAALAEAYGVDPSEVTSSFIGASWGADVTRQALFGLLAFLLLAAIVMALYFRTWKMSLAAILALLADLIVTTGVYAAVGWEISPAALIGILTILSYSLYDTVVVFDGVGEPRGEPDARAFDQHECRGSAARRGHPLHRCGRARRRHAPRHLPRAPGGHHRRHLVDRVPRRTALLAAARGRARDQEARPEGAQGAGARERFEGGCRGTDDGVIGPDSALVLYHAPERR